MTVLVLCLRVNELKGGWWIDLPELTSIQLGSSAFRFNSDNSSSELIMRSSDDGKKWWIDMPKLTSLTTVDYSSAFRNPRIITLEGISIHSILTNRHALSHLCHSWQGIRIQMQENPPHEEFLSLPSLIPRHHFRSPTVPQIPSFFHTRFTINSLQMTHSHFISLSIITPHSSAVPNRGMREDVRFCHFPSTCSIPSSTLQIT